MADSVVQLPSDTERACTNCGVVKSEDGFPTARTRSSWCRDCRATYSRAYRERNKERCSAQVTEWKRNNRDRARELNRLSNARLKAACLALYGGACQRCGFEDARALQIDHLNGARGQNRRSATRSGTGLYRAILNGTKPIEEFQLLCANCNWIKRDENGECRRG